MKIVAVHKISTSIVQMNEVTSITVTETTITVTGILATQTTTVTQSFNRSLWLIRIIES